MQYPDFSKARVGDRVWSVTNGQGLIRKIDQKHPYVLLVKFDFSSFVGSFSTDGKASKYDLMPSLFWSEIPIPLEALTPPKRTRKETRWFFVYPHHAYPCGWGASGLYNAKTGAEITMRGKSDAQGPFPVEIEV